MAIIATFKQKCPSCEAMVSIKENMIGKKVECTTCKDTFIAVRPVEKKATAIKKNPALQKKADTGITSKTPSGKKNKAVDEDVLGDHGGIRARQSESCWSPRCLPPAPCCTSGRPGRRLATGCASRAALRSVPRPHGCCFV